MTSWSAWPASLVSMRNVVGRLAMTPFGLTPSPVTRTLFASYGGNITELNGLQNIQEPQQKLRKSSRHFWRRVKNGTKECVAESSLAVNCRTEFQTALTKRMKKSTQENLALLTNQSTLACLPLVFQHRRPPLCKDLQ